MYMANAMMSCERSESAPSIRSALALLVLHSLLRPFDETSEGSVLLPFAQV
jgi:hypothetical protein